MTTENHPRLSDNNLNLNITATASTPVYSQRLEQLTFTGSQLFNVAWLANLFLFGTAVFIANYVVQLTPSFQDWSASTFSNILGGQETDTTEEVMDPMIENIIGKLVPRWKIYKENYVFNEYGTYHPSRLKENPFGLSTELPFGVRNESKQQVSRKKIPTIRSAAKLRTQKPKLLRLRLNIDQFSLFQYIILLGILRMICLPLETLRHLNFPKIITISRLRETGLILYSNHSSMN